MKNILLLILIISAILVTGAAIAGSDVRPFGISIDQASLDILTLTAKRFNDVSSSKELDNTVSVKAKIIIANLVNPDDMPIKLPDMISQARIEIIKKQPDLVRVNILTDFGKLQFISAGDNSITVLPDDRVFAKENFPEMLPPKLILPEDDGGLFTLINILGGIPFGSLFLNAPIGGPGIDIQFVEKIAPEDMKVVIRYRGLDKTEGGMVHVITIGSLLYKQYIKLWVHKDTFDLYQISIEDERGTEIFMVITEMDTGMPTPLDAFDIDTTGMRQINIEELIGRFLIKIVSSPAFNSPVIADFNLSYDPVARTGTVLVNSDGFDLQDVEDQLVCDMQYKSPNGSWTPLKTEYAGLAPVGHWNSEFTIPVDAELGKYSFRVRYIDKSGNISNWAEFPNIMTVTPEPPHVVKTIPRNGEQGVPAYNKISVTFSKPMNKLSVENTFAMRSRGTVIKGSFEWDGNTMIFTPNTDLESNTPYLLRISGSAKSEDNIGLDANYDAISGGEYIDDYIWDFTTGESVPMLALVPSKQSIYKGDIFDVKITAKDVTAMYKFSMKIKFDPQALEVIAISKESFLSWRPVSDVVKGADLWKNAVTDNLTGFVTFACEGTRKDGVSGSGYLATLTFRCKTAGKLSIKFSNVSVVDWNGTTIPMVLRDVEFQSLEFDPLDVNHDGVVDILDVVKPKENVKAAPPAGKFALGQNYPNPFNPETWIPYQLAHPADVTIMIYRATGEMVRILNVGYKQAGAYMDRDNSAYWDGRDDNGQKVSSGVYFYTIQADNFNATRKMLVQK